MIILMNLRHNLPLNLALSIIFSSISDRFKIILISLKQFRFLHGGLIYIFLEIREVHCCDIIVIKFLLGLRSRRTSICSNHSFHSRTGTDTCTSKTFPHSRTKIIRSSSIMTWGLSFMHTF